LNRLSLFIDDLEAPLEGLHSRLSVVERLYCSIPLAIEGVPAWVDMMPPSGISGSSKALVEDVQIEPPSTVRLISSCIDVGMESPLILNDSHTVPKIADVAPVTGIGVGPIGTDVRIGSDPESHTAAPSLKVPTPGMPLWIDGRAIWVDVMPAILSFHCCQLFVEPEGLSKSQAIGRLPIRQDVPRLVVQSHGRQSRDPVLQYLCEAISIGRRPAPEMMGAVWSQPEVHPAHACSLGFLMLQPLQSVLSW
jgi:hypothetical protein